MDMRYMDRLQVVVDDMVGLLRLKTLTYRDSWKRRGGPGAWFTTVRPWDRLETIVAREGGDIFAAIAKDPTGKDGSALACVRDVMAYMILIEAEARVNHGVGPHGPPRGDTIAEDLGATTCRACGKGPGHAPDCPVWTSLPGPGTPEDGGHHARYPVCEGLDDAGEVTQDTAGAGDTTRPSFEAKRSKGCRADELVARCRALASDLGLEVRTKIAYRPDGGSMTITIEIK